jgi:carboxymethylenebutenolidase
MQERQVDVPTKDGKTTTFIVHPDRGGPFPVILFYMDAPAIREELRDMARRFATSGYYVVLPNMYYRAGVMELGPLPTDPNDPKRKKMFDLMNSLTIPLVMDDTDAILRYIDGDKAASKGAMGTVGYCMSGQYATAAAVHYPDRVMAAHRSTARGSSPTRPTARTSPQRRPRPSCILVAPSTTPTRRWRWSRA